MGAKFCWNCGVESPHQAPAVTGNTVVQSAPAEPPAGFEWDARGASMRPGAGAPPEVPAAPTRPRTVNRGLPPTLPSPDAEDESLGDEPPTRPRMVVSMIAEELEEEPATDPRAVLPQAMPEEGSEPLSLEPEVDAAIAAATRPSEPTSLSDEVAELQLLLLRGFESEARDALSLLSDAHPGHPDLAPLERQLQGPEAVDAPDATLPGTDSPDITLVTRAPKRSNGVRPVEAPTSPTFVEGTAPPPGGFAAAPAVPRSVAPNVTPRLGIQSPLRAHMPSSDSLPTNPRMPGMSPSSTEVSAPPRVRVVMLGSRGQAVWERTLGPGEHIDIGREPAQPWGDDPHLESHHARLRSIPGGGVLVEPIADAGVFRQVDERLSVRDGDEFRVGESLLRYSAAPGGWGSLTFHPLSGESSQTVPIGGSGVLVGRENADIEIAEDTFVSGAHCRFSCRDEGLFIEDLGSANGTYSRVRGGEALPFGTLLLLGQTQFKIRRAGT